MNHKHMEDKIFEIQTDSQESIYKYFVMKINQIVQQDGKSVKLLVQILDMSDKMLYNEIKAEKSFLTLINAAISHELRNPLNALVGQMESLKNYFKNFKQIL